MQRLHPDDTIGNIDEKVPGIFRLLSFPAIAQQDELHDYRTPFGPRRFMRREGEALHPDREPVGILLEQQRLLGSMIFSAQYLQTPIPLEGNMVKRSWLRRYQPFEIMQPDQVIQSWDTASKAGQLNDYSVCTAWALKGDRFFLLDVIRERLDFPSLKRRVMEEATRHGAASVLIEDKGSGMSLIQDLQASGFWKGKAVLPIADKISRMAGVTAMIEEGRIYIPHHAVWLEDYLQELCAFPGSRYDDQVDSTSQALAWLREQGNPGGLWFYMQQEHAKQIVRRTQRTVQLRAPYGVNQAILDGIPVPIGPDGTLLVTEDQSGALMKGGFIRLP